MGHSAVTHAVIGMLNDKDIAGVVARLSTRVDHWYCASLGGPRGMTGKDVADIVRRVTQEAIAPRAPAVASVRSDEHTYELQSLMRNSYAVFGLKNKLNTDYPTTQQH